MKKVAFMCNGVFPSNKQKMVVKELFSLPDGKKFISCITDDVGIGEVVYEESVDKDLLVLSFLGEDPGLRGYHSVLTERPYHNDFLYNPSSDNYLDMALEADIIFVFLDESGGYSDEIEQVLQVKDLNIIKVSWGGKKIPNIEESYKYH